MTFSWASLYTNTDITRLQFETELRFRVDEDTADFVSATQMHSLVNAAIRYVCNDIGLIKSYADETASGASSYALPTDLTMLDAVYHIDSTGKSKLLIKSSPDQVANYLTSVTPEYWVRQGNTISIFGNPTSGTIRVQGTKRPDIPTVDGSYIDIPSQYMEALYCWCKYTYWIRRRMPDEMAIAKAEYNEVRERCREMLAEEYDFNTVMRG